MELRVLLFVLGFTMLVTAGRRTKLSDPQYRREMALQRLWRKSKKPDNSIATTTTTSTPITTTQDNKHPIYLGKPKKYEKSKENFKVDFGRYFKQLQQKGIDLSLMQPVYPEVQEPFPIMMEEDVGDHTKTHQTQNIKKFVVKPEEVILEPLKNSNGQKESLQKHKKTDENINSNSGIDLKKHFLKVPGRSFLRFQPSGAPIISYKHKDLPLDQDAEKEPIFDNLRNGDESHRFEIKVLPKEFNDGFDEGFGAKITKKTESKKDTDAKKKAETHKPILYDESKDKEINRERPKQLEEKPPSKEPVPEGSSLHPSFQPPQLKTRPTRKFRSATVSPSQRPHKKKAPFPFNLDVRKLLPLGKRHASKSPHVVKGKLTKGKLSKSFSSPAPDLPTAFRSDISTKENNNKRATRRKGLIDGIAYETKLEIHTPKGKIKYEDKESDNKGFIIKKAYSGSPRIVRVESGTSMPKIRQLRAQIQKRIIKKKKSMKNFRNPFRAIPQFLSIRTRVPRKLRTSKKGKRTRKSSSPTPPLEIKKPEKARPRPPSWLYEVSNVDLNQNEGVEQRSDVGIELPLHETPVQHSVTSSPGVVKYTTWVPITKYQQTKQSVSPAPPSSPAELRGPPLTPPQTPLFSQPILTTPVPGTWRPIKTSWTETVHTRKSFPSSEKPHKAPSVVLQHHGKTGEDLKNNVAPRTPEEPVGIPLPETKGRQAFWNPRYRPGGRLSKKPRVLQGTRSSHTSRKPHLNKSKLSKHKKAKIHSTRKPYKKNKSSVKKTSSKPKVGTASPSLLNPPEVPRPPRQHTISMTIGAPNYYDDYAEDDYDYYNYDDEYYDDDEYYYDDDEYYDDYYDEDYYYDDDDEYYYDDEYYDDDDEYYYDYTDKGPMEETPKQFTPEAYYGPRQPKAFEIELPKEVHTSSEPPIHQYLAPKSVLQNQNQFKTLVYTTAAPIPSYNQVVPHHDEFSPASRQLDDGILLPLDNHLTTRPPPVLSHRDHSLSASIPGQPGRDFPTLHSVPLTAFACANVPYPGYYADPEAQCQVFHVCHLGGRQDSFLCPNGTIFNQRLLVCDWWYSGSCATATKYYEVNAGLYKPGKKFGEPHMEPHTSGAKPMETIVPVSDEVKTAIKNGSMPIEQPYIVDSTGHVIDLSRFRNDYNDSFLQEQYETSASHSLLNPGFPYVFFTGEHSNDTLEYPMYFSYEDDPEDYDYYYYEDDNGDADDYEAISLNDLDRDSFYSDDSQVLNVDSGGLLPSQFLVSESRLSDSVPAGSQTSETRVKPDVQKTTDNPQTRFLLKVSPR